MRICAIIALFTVGAHAQQLPDPAALVEQAAEAVKQRKSYQFASEVTVTMDMNGKPMKMTITTTTAAVNPDKLHVDSKMSTGGGATIISDGEFTWTYIPMLKQYMRKAALGGPQAIMQSFGAENMPDAAKLTQATRTLRAEAVEVDGERHDCWVLETKLDKLPLPAPPGAELTEVVMTRWLDKTFLMDLRSELAGKMEAGPMKGAIQQEMRVHSIHFDAPLPDSLFTFTPPEGAKEVAEIAGFAAKKSDLTGKASPEFHLTSLQNGKLDFAALKGKPILLDFWTTWCAPCRKDLPALEKIYRDYRDQSLVMIAVNGGEEREVVEKFFQTEHVSYPIVLTENSDVLPAFEVTAFPTYVLIGSDGRIAGHQVGSQGEQGLHDLLAKVIGKRVDRQ